MQTNKRITTKTHIRNRKFRRKIGYSRSKYCNEMIKLARLRFRISNWCRFLMSVFHLFLMLLFGNDYFTSNFLRCFDLSICCLSAWCGVCEMCILIQKHILLTHLKLHDSTGIFGVRLRQWNKNKSLAPVFFYSIQLKNPVQHNNDYNNSMLPILYCLCYMFIYFSANRNIAEIGFEYVFFFFSTVVSFPWFRRRRIHIRIDVSSFVMCVCVKCANVVHKLHCTAWAQS